uniref:Uncharacterized protein n=1 Tax=Leersia perrieri TaxID=77586 RepID=A0A0D9WAN4_9ORYZ
MTTRALPHVKRPGVFALQEQAEAGSPPDSPIKFADPDVPSPPPSQIHRPSPTPPPPLHLNYPRSYTFPDPFHWRLKWGSPASVVLLIPWRRNRGQCRMVLNRELGASGGAPSSIPITLPFLSTISAGSITQDQTTQNLPASNFQKEFSYDVTRFSLSNENLPPRNSAS